MKFDEGFLAQMREATRLLQTKGPAAATEVIQRALHGAAADDGSGRAGAYAASRELLDAFLPAGRTPPTPAEPMGKSVAPAGMWRKSASRSGLHDIEDIEFVDARHGGKDNGEITGRFVSASCTNHAGTRHYKVYIPGCYQDEALPLVVMLHGCTQNPDDFAKGTCMNRLAEEGRFLVAYPEQNKAFNATECWNWFEPAHQQRGQGEPSIIADITREIAKTYRVDRRRIYIAGLSAGGAMAAVMAATYPELYAAVGMHSGLPYGVARDMPSAFAAMKRSRVKAASMKANLSSHAPSTPRMPVIVFHGDRDATVHPMNADQLLDQFAADSRHGKVTSVLEQGKHPDGRAYTRTTVLDASGGPIGEKWIIHGAGHAWSGGSREGSYTDPEGPSAAREMVRFFLQHQHT